MSDSSLDIAELESLQAAIRAAAPSRSAPTAPPDAVPMPLLASERDAASARPSLADLLVRWARHLNRIVTSFIGEVDLTPMGAEVIESTTLVDELRGMWTTSLATGGDARLVIAMGGDLIEAAAARRCGATTTATANRDPSAIALKLFRPVGDAVIATLVPAWGEVFETPLTLAAPADDAALIAALGREPVLAGTMMVSGATSGRIRVFARPETLVPTSTGNPMVPANGQAIAAALGSVPVEVRVELATLRMRWSQVRALKPGTQLTLPVFVDDPLPIYCGDVLKAWGRPVVLRGVLAVEIAALHVPGGGRP